MRGFLVVFVLAWIAGIAAGVFYVSWWVAAGIGIAGLMYLLGRRQPAVVVAAAGGLACLGFIWGSIAQPQPVVCTEQETWRVTMKRIVRREEQRVQYEAVTDDGCWLLATFGRFPEYRPGTRLEFSGRWQSVDQIALRLPGYANYLSRQGVGGTLQYPTAVNVSSNQPTAPSVADRLRHRVERLFPEPDASLVLAMLLGQRGTIPEEIQEQFRRTGVSHILAISGLHVSLIAGLFFALVSLMPLPATLRVGLTVISLWLYVLLIGQPISAIRAASFITIVLLALRLGMLVGLPTVVLLTVAALVSAKPVIFFDIGFQLSVSAVIGIGTALFVTRRLTLVDMSSWVVSLLIVSAGATLFTWPLVSYHFGTISFGSLAANLLVVPAVPAFLFLAGLAVLSGFVMWPLASALAWLVHLLWRWMDAATRWVAAVPFGFVEALYLPLWALAVYYILVLFTCWLIVRWQHRSWREIWQ